MSRAPTAAGSGERERVLRLALVAEQLRRPVAGGVGTYTRGLLLGLARRDPGAVAVEVELVASRPPAPRPRTPTPAPLPRTPSPSPSPSRSQPRAGGSFADPLERFGAPVRTSPLPGVLLTRAWALGLAGARGDWDVVHATSLAVPPRRRRPEGGRPVPIACTVHDLAWRRHPEATTPRGRRWHEAALRRAMRRAAAFVVPSAHVASDLIEAGARPETVTVVPEGSDHLPPPDLEGADELLRRHRIAGPYLLSVATMEPRKNLRRLVAAYLLARTSLPEPWPLVLVGPPGWGDAGVGGGNGPQTIGGPGVVVAGPVPDAVLAGLYAGARVLAYVPLTEGFGLPPLEAMSFGVPVVAGTGVPSVAPAGPHAPEAALRVEPGDVDAIADALVRAATDRDTRARLGAAGLDLARSLTWRRAADAHVAVWAALA